MHACGELVGTHPAEARTGSALFSRSQDACLPVSGGARAAQRARPARAGRPRGCGAPGVQLRADKCAFLAGDAGPSCVRTSLSGLWCARAWAHGSVPRTTRTINLYKAARCSEGAVAHPAQHSAQHPHQLVQAAAAHMPRVARSHFCFPGETERGLRSEALRRCASHAPCLLHLQPRCSMAGDVAPKVRLLTAAAALKRQRRQQGRATSCCHQHWQQSRNRSRHPVVQASFLPRGPRQPPPRAPPRPLPRAAPPRSCRPGWCAGGPCARCASPAGCAGRACARAARLGGPHAAELLCPIACCALEFP
jgi:hypothetical protein